MEILHHITKYICFLATARVYLFVFLLLLILKKYPLFRSLFIVCTTSVLINASLKFYFKTPLMPHLGPGYAFPSGHTQFATVFYGWLALSNFYKTRYFFLLITAIGFSTFDQHFHSINEIIAGFLIGFLIIEIFHQTPILNYKKSLFIFNTLLLTYILWQNSFYKDTIFWYYLINVSFLFNSEVERFYKKIISSKKGL